MSFPFDTTGKFTRLNLALVMTALNKLKIIFTYLLGK